MRAIKEAHCDAVGLEADLCQVLEFLYLLQGEVTEEAKLCEVQAHQMSCTIAAISQRPSISRNLDMFIEPYNKLNGHLVIL